MYQYCLTVGVSGHVRHNSSSECRRSGHNLLCSAEAGPGAPAAAGIGAAAVRARLLGRPAAEPAAAVAAVPTVSACSSCCCCCAADADPGGGGGGGAKSGSSVSRSVRCERMAGAQRAKSARRLSSSASRSSSTAADSSSITRTSHRCLRSDNGQHDKAQAMSKQRLP